jgi:hypothetical protein
MHGLINYDLKKHENSIWGDENINGLRLELDLTRFFIIDYEEKAKRRLSGSGYVLNCNPSPAIPSPIGIASPTLLQFLLE